MAACCKPKQAYAEKAAIWAFRDFDRAERIGRGHDEGHDPAGRDPVRQRYVDVRYVLRQFHTHPGVSENAELKALYPLSYPFNGQAEPRRAYSPDPQTEHGMAMRPDAPLLRGVNPEARAAAAPSLVPAAKLSGTLEIEMIGGTAAV